MDYNYDVDNLLCDMDENQIIEEFMMNVVS